MTPPVGQVAQQRKRWLTIYTLKTPSCRTPWLYTGHWDVLWDHHTWFKLCTALISTIWWLWCNTGRTSDTIHGGLRVYIPRMATNTLKAMRRISTLWWRYVICKALSIKLYSMSYRRWTPLCRGRYHYRHMWRGTTFYKPIEYMNFKDDLIIHAEATKTDNCSRKVNDEQLHTGTTSELPSRMYWMRQQRVNWPNHFRCLLRRKVLNNLMKQD